MTTQELKTYISTSYAEKLETSDGCCESEGSNRIYSPVEIELMPEGVVSFGCGNPVALASLNAGDRVLDLGSGAGMDCFLAAQEVGPSGSVIGVDFTQAMTERAEENVAKLGLENVSFRLGDIEALPVDDFSVDLVMSNCVINLAPDKDAVFSEAFRVLSPGGRLVVTDIVLTRPATTEEKEDMALLTGCVSGSLPVDEYLQKVRYAGFRDVEYVAVAPASGDQFWFSAAISGCKPE
jgi:SAM-dependent methyltransferase